MHCSLLPSWQSDAGLKKKSYPRRYRIFFSTARAQRDVAHIKSYVHFIFSSPVSKSMLQNLENRYHLKEDCYSLPCYNLQSNEHHLNHKYYRHRQRNS